MQALLCFHWVAEKEGDGNLAIPSGFSLICQQMAAVNSIEHLDRLSCTFLHEHVAVMSITLHLDDFCIAACRSSPCRS